MVWKLGKVLCCMFLFAILGVDPAQNSAKYKRYYAHSLSIGPFRTDKFDSKQQIRNVRRHCTVETFA